ncbi:kinase-like domain-containing protein [Aspergillus ambiguus]|uniref:kinase-like domain-containing protein n=1 Tax=Aspergillus ambiguus TaxID=176160 RepID=UPI003CCE4B49
MTKAIRTIEDLSTEFLSQALGGKVASYSCERIGTGQVGECYRIHLEYAPEQTGPASAVIKLAASGALSQGSGRRLGIYRRESHFYSDIAPTLEGCPFVVKCYDTAVDGENNTFHILLEDIRPAVVGNEIIGASLEDARLSLKALGTLQRASWNLTYPEWLNTGTMASQTYLQKIWKAFLDRYGEKVKHDHRQVVERWLSCFDKYAAKLMEPGTKRCLIHGDYRLDNMLFRHDPGEQVSLSVVDWQMLNLGPAFQDLGFFLGVSVPTDLRRAHGEELVQVYYEALGPNPPFTLAECHQGLREQAFMGLPLAFASPMILEQTTRGDEMFLTMLDRLATYLIDLNAVETLPDPAAPTPLAVNSQDEISHPAGDDPLHNESWYFDVADIDQGIGVWVRLGVTPNQPGSWYNALICGPGRPTVAVVDFQTPTPGPDLVINSDKIKATHTPDEPLKQYRLTLIGRGESFDDPAALLCGERGRPVPVHVDLTWHTTGTPYQWRIATRYEIPCTVTGTILVDDSVTTLSHAPGQRDHSWGTRDWWSFDWVWSAFHLDDGTQLHGVQVRLPTGAVGVGYIQSTTIPIAELSGVDVMEQVSPDGLPQTALIKYSSDAAEDVVLHIKPLGQAPVRLESPDGRLSLFPRLWAEVCSQDGRKGVGWIEWNFCQGSR